MSAKESPTGLYQYVVKQGDRLCVDCVTGVLETNPGMTREEWRAARVDDAFAASCDSCDCVPAELVGAR